MGCSTCELVIGGRLFFRAGHSSASKWEDFGCPFHLSFTYLDYIPTRISSHLLSRVLQYSAGSRKDGQSYTLHPAGYWPQRTRHACWSIVETLLWATNYQPVYLLLDTALCPVADSGSAVCTVQCKQQTQTKKLAACAQTTCVTASHSS